MGKARCKDNVEIFNLIPSPTMKLKSILESSAIPVSPTPSTCPCFNGSWKVISNSIYHASLWCLKQLSSHMSQKASSNIFLAMRLLFSGCYQQDTSPAPQPYPLSTWSCLDFICGNHWLNGHEDDIINVTQQHHVILGAVRLICWFQPNIRISFWGIIP